MPDDENLDVGDLYKNPYDDEDKDTTPQAVEVNPLPQARNASLPLSRQTPEISTMNQPSRFNIKNFQTKELNELIELKNNQMFLENLQTFQFISFMDLLNDKIISEISKMIQDLVSKIDNKNMSDKELRNALKDTSKKLMPLLNLAQSNDTKDQKNKVLNQLQNQEIMEPDQEKLQELEKPLFTGDQNNDYNHIFNNKNEAMYSGGGSQKRHRKRNKKTQRRRKTGKRMKFRL